MAIASFVEVEPTDDNQTDPQLPATVEDDGSERTLAVAGPTQELAGMSGHIGNEQLEIPWLTLVSGSSKLASDFRAGAFVYDKSIEVGKSMDVIIMNVHTSFEESTDMDGGADSSDAERWATLAEAEASGLPFKAVGEIALLIVVADEHPLAEFAWINHEGKAYVPAKWTVRGSKSRAFGGAYQCVVPKYRVMVERGVLAGDAAGGVFHVESDQQQWAGTTYYRPITKRAGVTPPEVRTEIRELFNL